MLTNSLAPIDWLLLGEAVDFYRKAGYEYVELPYAVKREITDITLPPELGDPMMLSHRSIREPLALVGSAEQSFLDADLEPGLYVGCTPCFRAEACYDSFRQPHFMKVELFDSRERPDAWTLMFSAMAFMSMKGANPVVEPTSAGWDLMVNGIEVGSYGRRSHACDDVTLQWAYGTGLALPRFTVARDDL